MLLRIRKNILSNLLLLIILSGVNLDLPAQDKSQVTIDDFVEIRIQEGLTIFGSRAICLTYEGLLYREGGSTIKVPRSRFIKLHKLNNSALLDCFQFIKDNDLLNHVPLEGQVFTTASPITVVCRDYADNLFGWGSWMGFRNLYWLSQKWRCHS